jgi:transposase
MEEAVHPNQSARKAHGCPSLGTSAISLSETDCAKIVAEACRPPKDVGIPVRRWSESLLGGYLRQQGFVLSDSTVGRILRGAMLQPHRQTMWLTSQDEEFREKRDDVLHVYYDTPSDEHIICLDEKPGIQALERRHPDIPMEPGQPVRREFEYIRHGTLCLMGAYDVRTGKLFGFTDQHRGGDTFLDLLDCVDTCYPTGNGHLVMDNLTDHDTDEVNQWFDEHPRWTRHFTPKHASWLNQIEEAFSILQGRAISGGSWTHVDELRDDIYQYILWHNIAAKPSSWTYRPKSWAVNRASSSDGRH